MRNAFAHVAEAIEQESYCHYKFKDYKRRRDTLRLQQSGPWFSPPFAVVAALPICFMIAMCLPFPWNLNLGLIFFWLFAAFLGLIQNRAHSREVFHRFAVTSIKWGLIGFDFFVFRWQLGYGVYPLRVFRTSIVTILAFALIYSSASWFANEDVGYIVREGRTVFGEPVGKKAAETAWEDPMPSRWVSARRLVYFSTMTFTTTGYGDFTPEGHLQWLASLETLLGVVLISILTVVFARQFIR